MKIKQFLCISKQGELKTTMIPVFRSIDNLLNRFDELSKCHTNFLSDFNLNFPDVENPLRNVTRTEEEQKKTVANIRSEFNENINRKLSTNTIEDFHRRVIVNRFHHHPPNYSLNDQSTAPQISSRTSSIVTDLSEPQRASITTTTTTNESKIKVPIKIKPKLLIQHSPIPRRSTRNGITTFTIETINRLSKPKIYPQVSQRSKPYQTNSLMIKRAKTTIIKPFIKELKYDIKLPMKQPIPQTLIPTITLSFPKQQQTQPIASPNTIIRNRRSMLFFKPSY
ncbi:hypothetical protein I4U23_000435 [Adineta vaga]|nr:hypothetical protein I4U23_000435 [Adineta vaga]